MEKAHILVSLSDLVFLPDSKEYKASTNSYFTAFENEINPLCVAQPRDVKELSQLLQKVSEISDLSVAVRGGGHTPWAGAANVEGGITVDLLHFKGIEVDTKAGLVHIGARETWGDVYGKLAEHSLGVSGGRVSRVAVSGLTLGGPFKSLLSV
jgi:FAD/FMN-containing dehydrogenase